MAKSRRVQILDLGLDSGVCQLSRTIYLTGIINDDMSRQAVTALMGLDLTEGAIRIVLDSGGGDVDAGFAIYDAIRQTKNVVIIDVVGSCQSMAMMVIQAATYRRATPESRFLLHNGSAGFEVAMHAVKSMAREIAYQHNRYCEIVAARSEKSPKEIEKLCNSETFLSAQEALTLGLIDDILELMNPYPVKKVVAKKRRAPKSGRK